jgi:hypothetical protein
MASSSCWETPVGLSAVEEWSHWFKYTNCIYDYDYCMCSRRRRRGSGSIDGRRSGEFAIEDRDRRFGTRARRFRTRGTQTPPPSLTRSAEPDDRAEHHPLACTAGFFRLARQGSMSWILRHFNVVEGQKYGLGYFKKNLSWTKLGRNVVANPPFVLHLFSRS